MNTSEFIKIAVALSELGFDEVSTILIQTEAHIQFTKKEENESKQIEVKSFNINVPR